MVGYQEDFPTKAETPAEELDRLKRERTGLMDQVQAIDDRAATLVESLRIQVTKAEESWPHVVAASPRPGWVSPSERPGTFVRTLDNGIEQRRLANGQLVNVSPDGTAVPAMVVRDNPHA